MCSTHLPFEIINKIMEYTRADDMLLCRLVSSNWNEILSRLLRRNQVPVKFLKNVDNVILQFLETMKGRLQNEPPFSAYEFHLYVNPNLEDDNISTEYPSLEVMSKFTEALGPYVTSYTIHLQHFYEGKSHEIVQCLLSRSPNLNTLKLYGQTQDQATIPPIPGIYLPKLRNLVIMPFSPEVGWCPTDSDHVGPQRLSTAEFSSWLSHPALNDVQIGFGVSFESELGSDARFKTIQHLIAPYDMVQFEAKGTDTLFLEGLSQGHSLNLRELTLQMNHSMNLTLIHKALQGVSLTLKKLTLKEYKLREYILFPCLLNLDTLELDFSEARYSSDEEIERTDPISSSEFPNLTTVVLKYYQCTAWETLNESWSLFEGSIFESVEKLELVEYDREGIEPWHKIFPNLKAFEIRPLWNKMLPQRHLHFIFTHLHTLKELKLHNISNNSASIFTYLTNGDKEYEFGTGVQNYCNEFGLAGFPDLKLLELWGNHGDMKDVGMALIYLSTLKKMACLDYLILHGIPQVDVKRYQLVLNTLKYHTNVLIDADTKKIDNSMLDMPIGKSNIKKLSVSLLKYKDIVE